MADEATIERLRQLAFRAAGPLRGRSPRSLGGERRRVPAQAHEDLPNAGSAPRHRRRRLQSGERDFEDPERIAELMDVYADSDIGFVDASLVALTERLRETKVG